LIWDVAGSEINDIGRRAEKPVWAEKRPSRATLWRQRQSQMVAEGRQDGVGGEGKGWWRGGEGCWWGGDRVVMAMHPGGAWRDPRRDGAVTVEKVEWWGIGVGEDVDGRETRELYRK
jgi:hypothetical protein